MANGKSDTFELRHGNDQASATEVTLTSAQKEKITNAIVQAILDETKASAQNLGFWQFGWGRYVN
jgi:hypothetical protein